LQLEEKKQLKH